VLVVALLAGLLSGCSDSSSAAPASTTNDLPNLVLIGDSITHRSADVLTEALSDRYNVTIVAEDGRTIAEQQEGASQAAESSPDYVLINLGTNDAVKGVSLEDAEKGLVDMAAKFPDACIVFTTINKNTTIPVYNAKASALNDWLFANAEHIAPPHMMGALTTLPAPALLVMPGGGAPVPPAPPACTGGTPGPPLPATPAPATPVGALSVGASVGSPLATPPLTSIGVVSAPQPRKLCAALTTSSLSRWQPIVVRRNVPGKTIVSGSLLPSSTQPVATHSSRKQRADLLIARSPGTSRRSRAGCQPGCQRPRPRALAGPARDAPSNS